MRTIGGLLAKVAARHPERLALLGDRPLTFQELEAAASQVSRQLLARGLRPGDRVAYLDENSARAAVALFGVVRAGLIYVPVHPQLQPGEIATLFADARPAALLVGPTRAEAVAQLPAEVLPPLVLPLTLDGIAELVAAGTPIPALPEVSPEAVSMLLYTSGTTGGPKGVMLTHAGCLYNADLQINGYEMDEQTVAAVVVPHSVTGAINCMLLPALQCGGAAVYLPTGFRPEEFLQAVQRYRITHVQVVPTMVVRLLDWPDLAKYDTGSLRAVCYGSAPMPVSRLRDGLARLGPVFVQVYGQTECVAMATCLRHGDHQPDGGPEAVERLGSAGRPQPGISVRVVDEHGRPLPVGQVGEVVIQGPNVMAGYWRRTDATAAALKDGWLHTGDLGRADADGFIYIVDRQNDIIKSGGMTVSPSEVESVLYTHEAVLEAAVIGVPDPEWGEAVTAVVVLREGARAAAAELIEYCRPRMAPFKKPKQILFISALPRSPMGKILRRKLRELYRQGVIS
jgi:acyl-CoA synthetase (AMP-forming)/AMP-acid ligase II